MKVRVALPYHLRMLARVEDEVALDVAPPVTIRAVLDALEAEFPTLRGAIREHGTLKRRAFVRYFACQQDISHESAETALPEEVARGDEPFIVLGAIAGG
jgi:hypothetical protein